MGLWGPNLATTPTTATHAPPCVREGIGQNFCNFHVAWTRGIPSGELNSLIQCGGNPHVLYFSFMAFKVRFQCDSGYSEIINWLVVEPSL